MGQAVDLPDSAQATASAAATSADDLLSQLAGDEIDRLLAESDAESAAQAEAQPAAPIAAEPAEASATASASVAKSSAAPVSSAAPATEGLANELDSLLSRAVAKDTSPATTESPTSAEAPSPEAQVAESPAAESPAAAAPAATESTAAATESASVDAKAFDASLAAQTPSPELQATVNEIETTLQERSGLADSTAGDPAVEAADETPIPIYLKPLVWLNSPLTMLPEPIRDAIGKIALLTLFNSVAVLAYVLLFRRHHH